MSAAAPERVRSRCGRTEGISQSTLMSLPSAVTVTGFPSAAPISTAAYPSG